MSTRETEGELSRPAGYSLFFGERGAEEFRSNFATPPTEGIKIIVLQFEWLYWLIGADVTLRCALIPL
jgi:hypothetical protein